VHQTAAGKMIFGRVDEKGMESAALARGAAAGAVRGTENGGTRAEMVDGEGHLS
jgi:hypothetical protein